MYPRKLPKRFEYDSNRASLPTTTTSDHNLSPTISSKRTLGIISSKREARDSQQAAEVPHQEATQWRWRSRTIPKRLRGVHEPLTSCFMFKFFLLISNSKTLSIMTTIVIVCHTIAAQEPQAASASRVPATDGSNLDHISTHHVSNDNFAELDWPRISGRIKLRNDEESRDQADDLNLIQPATVLGQEITRIRNEKSPSLTLPAGSVSKNYSSTARPRLRSINQTEVQFDDDNYNPISSRRSSVEDEENYLMVNMTSLKVQNTRPARQLLLALDESREVAAATQQNSQSHCALILKRTYIFKGDEDHDEGAASNEVASASMPQDEWGERFVFDDNEPADQGEGAHKKKRRMGRVSESRRSKKTKIHKMDLCIKHSDVDKAIEEAKHKIKFQKPADIDSSDVSERSIASVGELNLATGLLLTKRFDLSHDEILNALPMIDMMSSLSLHQHQMESLCPKHVKSMACSKTRYRTLTAHCNNIMHPTWGASKTPYSRYLPPDYADGLSAPRAARDGHPLPSARLISSKVHVDLDEPSHDYSIAFADWGQLLNHDVTRVAVGEAPDCCPQLLKGLCMPIPVPPNDPLYSQFNVKCLKFDRSLAAIRPKCLLGHRAQINLITSPVDASFVYGSTNSQAQRLRTHKGGKMKVWNYFEKLKLKPIMPPKTENPDQDCLARPKSLFCFEAGDVRANEQTLLTVLHTVYLREHNRIAKQLGALNLDWDDDKIYHETRHIVAAGVQHVMMNEFAPLVLGKHHMHEYKLKPLAEGHWNGYDPSVTISTGTGFAAAGFRYGHSMIEGLIARHDPRSGHFIKGELLRFLFKRPFMLYEPGAIDQLIAGMLLTPSEQTDPYVSEELSGHLFQPPKAKFGHDLAAINIQRGRDQGVPGYNDWREWCGLSRAKSFSDLEPLLMNKTAWLYDKTYKHVDDIDLWSAGISERKLPGAAVGPTMACIIARQFLNYKRGDRFWYENGHQPSSFTLAQLREIKKITLAKILCTNADDLPKIQPWAMRLPHPIYNAKVPCESLPGINLKYWDSSLVDNFD